MESLLIKLLDNSLTLGILGLGLYFMWKENSAYRKKQDAELESLKAETHQYFTEDREKMQTIIEHNTVALAENTKSTRRTNEILACIIPELSAFKKSEVYKSYENEKKS